jgi:hypothetical protein
MWLNSGAELPPPERGRVGVGVVWALKMFASTEPNSLILAAITSSITLLLTPTPTLPLLGGGSAPPAPHSAI